MADNDTYTGGPAYPVRHAEENVHTGQVTFHQYAAPGMTLRDYFAGQALAGYLATYGDHPHPAQKGKCDVVAADAYAMADAMLRARQPQRFPAGSCQTQGGE